MKASLLTAKMTVALERLLVRPLNLPLELEYISVFKPTPANELAQKWAARDPSAIKSVEELLATVGRTIESVQSSALEMAIDCIGRIDRLIVSAEARRNSAWREINRHRDRKAFVRSLRDEVRNIENAEVKRDEIIRPADVADKDAA